MIVCGTKRVDENYMKSYLQYSVASRESTWESSPAFGSACREAPGWASARGCGAVRRLSHCPSFVVVERNDESCWVLGAKDEGC